jgi:two-component system NtrC family sensor kinase
MSASDAARPTGRPYPGGIGWVLPVAAVLVPLSVLAVVGWMTWNSVWEDARRDIVQQADAVGEYGVRALQSYSVAAGRLNDRLRGLSDDDIFAQEQALHDELRHFDSELSQSELSYVIDRQGYPLVASNQFPAARGVS